MYRLHLIFAKVMLLALQQLLRNFVHRNNSVGQGCRPKRQFSSTMEAAVNPSVADLLSAAALAENIACELAVAARTSTAKPRLSGHS